MKVSEFIQKVYTICYLLNYRIVKKRAKKKWVMLSNVTKNWISNMPKMIQESCGFDSTSNSFPFADIELNNDKKQNNNNNKNKKSKKNKKKKNENDKDEEEEEEMKLNSKIKKLILKLVNKK